MINSAGTAIEDPSSEGLSYQKTTHVAWKWWVRVVAPINCNYFGVRNAGDGPVLMRTPGASKTEFSTLGPGVQDSVTVSFPGPGTRFAAGELIFYVRSSDRTRQTVVVTWIR